MARGTMLAVSVLLALGAGGLPACSASADQGDDGSGELGQSPDEVKEQIPGPVAKSTDAEVWAVTNQWADTSTPAAQKAGIAWGESSGLSWEEKYAKWVASFVKVDSPRNGYGKTVQFQNPQGRTLMGPVLECADFGMFLRLAFSAWYHLPFYMTGFSNGQTVYFGHFGVVDKNGDPVPGWPLFKAKYRDYEPSWQPGSDWPHDPTLRGVHVGQDDSEHDVVVDTTKLADADGSGAYMDEAFLNKRVGYFQKFLDNYFGSTNLADGANMFHIQPEATRPGDLLLERFSKTGIGHTLPVITLLTLPNGKMRVSVASGSMPRREPSWEDEAQSAGYFKSDEMGGQGSSGDDPPVPYAKLGGGIRRYRTPIVVGGRWENDVPKKDHDIYIEDANLDAIAARPAHWAQLLAEDTPEGARDAALAIIASARQSLHDHPASCSARTKARGCLQGPLQSDERLVPDGRARGRRAVPPARGLRLRGARLPAVEDVLLEHDDLADERHRPGLRAAGEIEERRGGRVQAADAVHGVRRREIRRVEGVRRVDEPRRELARLERGRAVHAARRRAGRDHHARQRRHVRGASGRDAAAVERSSVAARRRGRRRAAGRQRRRRAAEPVIGSDRLATRVRGIARPLALFVRR